MTNRKDQPKPGQANSKPAELNEAALDDAAGGKHPAKVTIPDLKLTVGYD